MLQFWTDILDQLTSTRVKGERKNWTQVIAEGHKQVLPVQLCRHKESFCEKQTKAAPRRRVPQCSMCSVYRTSKCNTRISCLAIEKKKTPIQQMFYHCVYAVWLHFKGKGTIPPDPFSLSHSLSTFDSTCLPCRLTGNQFTTRLLLLFCVWHTLQRYHHYVNQYIEESSTLSWLT